MLRRNNIFWLALGVVITLSVGWLVWNFIFCREHDVILALTLAIAAVITFFGFLKLAIIEHPEQGRKFAEGGMRTAITVSLVTVYLILIIFSIFVKGPDELTPLTETMVNSFTTVIGVVIAFYFGATAYVEGMRISKNKKQKKSETDIDHAKEP